MNALESLMDMERCQQGQDLDDDRADGQHHEAHHDPAQHGPEPVQDFEEVIHGIFKWDARGGALEVYLS